MTWPVSDDDDHHAAVHAIEHSGSDPTAAIVGGAMLEKALTETLGLRLRKHRDFPDKLLKESGVLGNAGPKVDVLYALRLIELPAHRTLLGLVAIRNYFAHNLGAAFDSDNKRYQDAVRLLCLHEGLDSYPHVIFKRPSATRIEPIRDNRDLFRVNLKLGLNVLMHVRTDYVPHTLTKRTPEERAEVERAWLERNPTDDATP